MSRSVLRRWAAVGLCVLAVGCGDRIDELVAKLQHPDADQRRAAVRELCRQTVADDRVVAALTIAVGDEDSEVRRLSAQALGSMGPPAAASLPALREALTDPEIAVQRSAALAMQRIDPADRGSVGVLVAAMGNGDGRTILAVGALGERASWAVPTLVDLLSHDLPQVRALAAQSLGRIGAPTSEARHALERALNDPNVAVQSAAQSALKRLDSRPAKAVQP